MVYCHLIYYLNFINKHNNIKEFLYITNRFKCYCITIKYQNKKIFKIPNLKKTLNLKVYGVVI